MKSSAKQLLYRIRNEAKRRPNRVVTRAMGRKRYFRAYDLGEDTFIFERGVWLDLDAHASVLMIEKRDLRRGARGHVMTVTTGNHSVAALPLLQGLFWDLCRLNAASRGDVMTHAVLCGNVVDGKLEISQRDVPCARLVALDDWLIGTLKFALADVVMVERNDVALEHFRARGQEWRVKPLAWTEAEMKLALAASRKRISCSTRYYHGSRGVHFLSYAGFHALVGLARTDFAAFRAALRELTSVFEGHAESFLRQPKFHGHHEVELFGLRRGVALQQLVPELEKLMEGIVLGRHAPADAAARAEELDALYKSLLSRPELADENSPAFISSLYMHLTGEVYSVVGEGVTPAFDDRRTALPGATFENGRPVFHPLADARSRVLLSNIRVLGSKDEYVTWANVYELRTKDEEMNLPLGQGSTREIVYKTNRKPLEYSLVEKRLSRNGRAYGSYVLARAKAFKALGVELPNYRLLFHGAFSRSHAVSYFIRSRCEGEPITDIPALYFQHAGEFGGAEAGEDPQVVRAFAALMGDAAAQNLILKKYDARTRSCLFGQGKEIYRFGYDIKAGRLMPLSVSCCSMRGVMGWPDEALTDRNLDAVAHFYLPSYAKALADFAAAHPVCSRDELAERFFAGFELRLKSLEWRFTVQRNDFEDFDPHLPPRFGFLPKWRFALWALERHVRRIGVLRNLFMRLVENPDDATIVAPSDDVGFIEDANAQNLLSALEDLQIHFVGED